MTARFLITLAVSKDIDSTLSKIEGEGFFYPRIAMVGRSNVGKSSLLNELLGAKLARTSSEPGKTRHLHFYAKPDLGVVFVDVPGYGYAKVSRDEIARFSDLIAQYFKRDASLSLALWLIDARNGPTANDLEAAEFLRSSGVPFLVVLTKTDALKTQKEKSARTREITKALGDLEINSDSIVWTSVKSRDGISLLKKKIRDCIQEQKA